MAERPLAWALFQPKGNAVQRLVAYALHHVLNRVATVTVDLGDLVVPGDAHVVLAPTHRSLLDFLVVGFVAFSLPEVLGMPSIVASEEFRGIPLVGWLVRLCGAFFARRGGSQQELKEAVEKKKSMHHVVEQMEK